MFIWETFSLIGQIVLSYNLIGQTTNDVFPHLQGIHGRFNDPRLSLIGRAPLAERAAKQPKATLFLFYGLKIRRLNFQQIEIKIKSYFLDFFIADRLKK